LQRRWRGVEEVDPDKEGAEGVRGEGEQEEGCSSNKGGVEGARERSPNGGAAEETRCLLATGSMLWE
jgi:hypothetical protein